MKMQAMAFAAVALALLSGCTSLKRIDDDPRYFGDFRTDVHYVTKAETIMTPDLRRAIYGERFFPPKRFFLVAAKSGAATNYVRGKFSGLKRTDPVSEIGRLPIGTRLAFTGVETLVVPLESPRPAYPLAKVLDGPFRGTEVCIFYLCADKFMWGWPQTSGKRSDLDNGRQIEVFSPSEAFLLPEPK